MIVYRLYIGLDSNGVMNDEGGSPYEFFRTRNEALAHARGLIKDTQDGIDRSWAEALQELGEWAEPNRADIDIELDRLTICRPSSRTVIDLLNHENYVEAKQTIKVWHMTLTSRKPRKDAA